MKTILLLLLLMPVSIYADTTAVVGPQWKQIDSTIYPADDVTGINISGLSNYTGFPAGGASNADYFFIQDKKAQNTQSGTFTSGAWRTRDINDEIVDTGGFVNISSNNQFIIQAGTYQCTFSAPAYYVRTHQARLYNITDATIIALGTSAFNLEGIDVVTRSIVEGRFTVAAAKVLEIQHRALLTRADDGFGIRSNFTDEIYTIGVCRREI
jgi:hypothetical protein